MRRSTSHPRTAVTGISPRSSSKGSVGWRPLGEDGCTRPRDLVRPLSHAVLDGGGVRVRGRTCSPSTSGSARWRRSTVRCSGRGARWRPARCRPRRHRTRWTRSTRRCWPGYVEAFERYDIESLVALLHGRDAVHAAVRAVDVRSGRHREMAPRSGRRLPRIPPGRGRGERDDRSRAVQAGGVQARYEPWAIHLLEMSGGRITSITNFLGAHLFGLFGLPDHLLDGEDVAQP